ncbi:MAG: hypothetical protein NXI01_09140 [Gammaproteobacteria bacterium]|nr:hypothetical protein [Gammaproteobacteria bacterium]
MTASLSDTLPQALCVDNARKLACSSKAVMGFLINTFNAKLTHLRATEEYSDITAALNETNKVTELRSQFLEAISSKTFRGAASKADLDKIKSQDTFNYMDIPAMEGMAEINEQLGADQQVSQIVMAYYVDENAQINRGYVVNDQVVDESTPDGKKMMGVIDKMFHSWLVSHDMASDEQGFIYHRNKNGDLGEKLAGTEVETFKSSLEDPNTGFQTTIDKIDPKIQIGLIWAPPEEPEGPSPAA